MVYISEFLPNPTGPDAAGEFIELYNGGPADVSLKGWRIGTGTASTTPSGETIVPAKTKAFQLTGFAVPARGYLVLKHAEDGISLKNTDGALLLYGPEGDVADKAAFHGAAPEGQSYSRMDGGADPGRYFVFTDPTPGALNAVFGGNVSVEHHQAGVPLGPPPAEYAPALAAFSAIGFGAFLAAIITYAIKKNENISNVLFGGDKAPRRGIFEAAFRRPPAE